MDISDIQLKLESKLPQIDSIEDIHFYQVDEYSIKGNATVKKIYNLNIRFKTFHERMTLSFALIY
ncbi:MAG TPA: hypothetical protein PK079_10210 [Leptospiraceae bacterium]|nr:hypothetical protein [Leptospiraceae bacterium]HMW06646.1 hypothetical protein [Leptospiraceae bacterium]HMX35525.1 hypothetical protein [Leptospiraceae bacterium]HMY33697.1 hypothetical protein [Leptospiraceae bacterium]HMZ64901.1 hypothetical protein [Leptospiraceae bacterium]